MDLLQHFHSYIKTIDPQKEARYLLAVSGGVDSTVLATLFHQCGLSFAVAHCNFSLRGVESDLDETHALAIAESYHAQVYIKRFNTSEYAIVNKISIQMAARQLRYDWFESLSSEYGFRYIVTAHHADDHAETMLLNLIRGKGLAALAGIKREQEVLLRPLLDVSKQDILSFARAQKLVWREDASNLTDDYDRNFLRNQVIPKLRVLNPSLEKTMGYSSALLREAEAMLNSAFESWQESHVTLNGGKSIIENLSDLWKHPLKINFLFRLLRRHNFHAAVIKQITDQSIPQSGAIFSSHSHEVYFDRNSMIITPVEAEDVTILEITHEGTYTAGNAGLSVEYIKHAGNLNSGRNILYADAGKLDFPLVLRHWQKGDAFHPLGMKGRKKVSDFLIDEKVPLPDKKNVRVLLSGADIVWVIGLRPDERFKVTGETKDIIKITFAPTDGTTAF